MLVNPVNVRYRRISMSGLSTPAVATLSESLKPKEILFEFSRKNECDGQINLKIVEEDYFKKYKLENSIKSLLRAYD
jgi:hypothetical protein